MTFVLQMQQQQLALQEHMICLLARLLPDEQNAPTPSRNQRVKPECLVIESDTSDNKWIIFRDAWSCYKEMTQLTDSTEAQNELRSAFSSSVNIMLEYVKSVHPEVFSNFSQWSRAMEKPSRCLYPDWSHKRCSVPLKDNVVVITSTAQPHSLRTWLNPKSLSAHQNKILMEINSLPTLNDLVRRLLTLESTTRKTNHFQPTEAPQITPIKSVSSRKLPPHNKNKTNNSKCKGCAYKAHPKGHSQCLTWGKSCHKCGTENHFSYVCRGIASSNAVMEDNPNDTQDENISLQN